VVGVPSDHDLFDNLADDGRAEVIAGVVADTLSDPALRADRIHPNAAGYAAMAKAAAEVLRRCR
jgi:acyl-CoA hydrolase